MARAAGKQTWLAGLYHGVMSASSPCLHGLSTMPSIAVRFDGTSAFNWTGNNVEIAGVLGAWRDIEAQ